MANYSIRLTPRHPIVRALHARVSSWLLWPRDAQAYLYSIAFAGLSGVASLAVTVLAARLVGAGQYAWIVFGLAVGNITVPLANMGSDRTLVRDLVALHSSEDKSSLVSANLRCRVVVCLAITIGLLIFGGIYAGVSHEALTIVAAGLWALLQGMYPYSLYDYVRRTPMQNGLALIERIVALGLVIGCFVLRKPLGQAWIIALILLTTRLVSVAWQYAKWPKLGHGLHLSPRGGTPFRDSGISAFVTVVQLSSACVGYVSQLFLGGSNRADLAAYGLAFQIASFVLVFQHQVLRLLLNEIASVCHSMKNAARTVLKHVILMGAAASGFAVMSWILIYVLSRYLADPGFRRMPVFAGPLCLWSVIAGIGLVVSQYVIGFRLEKRYLAVNLAGGLAMLVLAAIFVPKYGAMAAAILLLLVHGGMIVAQTLIVLPVVVRPGLAGDANA